MSCGMITFTELGLADQIERYVAYEYDVKSVGKKGAGEFGFPAVVASHNFPNIEQRGDIFKADFTEFKDFDYILAGFPCTKFSIAQKKDRETKPYCGEGWDMFEKAWEAVQVAQPRFFLFENNTSPEYVSLTNIPTLKLLYVSIRCLFTFLILSSPTAFSSIFFITTAIL